MDMDVAAGTIVSSTFVVWIIDLLKRTEWFPWLGRETLRANQIAAVIGAIITAAGIHFVMEPAVETGTYTMHITGLSLANLWHLMEGVASSVVTQQGVLMAYQGRNLLRKIAGE